MQLQRFQEVDKDLNALFPKGNIQKMVKIVAQVLADSLYSDNSIVTFENTDDAIAFCKLSPKLMELGNFKLSKFTSNDKNVLQHVDISKQQTENTSILGLLFDSQSDTLQVPYPPTIPDSLQLTKRQVLKYLPTVDAVSRVCLRLANGRSSKLCKAWEASFRVFNQKRRKLIVPKQPEEFWCRALNRSDHWIAVPKESGRIRRSRTNENRRRKIVTLTRLVSR